jgi:hypothetical protein
MMLTIQENVLLRHIERAEGFFSVESEDLALVLREAKIPALHFPLEIIE